MPVTWAMGWIQPPGVLAEAGSKLAAPGLAAVAARSLPEETEAL